MGEINSYVNQIEPILKKVVNKDNYIIFLIFTVIEMLLVIILTILVATPLVFYALSKNLFTNPVAYTNPVLLAEIIGLGAILFVIWLLLIILIGAVFEGARLTYAMSILKGKKKSFGESITVGKEKMLSLFGASLIWMVALLLLVTIIMSPAIIGLIGMLPNLQTITSGGNAALAIIVIYSIFAFLLIWIATLVIIPFSTMAAPAVVFENLGAVEGVKRGIGLVKGNFLANIIYLVIVGLIVFAIGLVPGFIFGMFDFIIQMIAGFASAGNVGLALGVLGIYALLKIIIDTLMNSLYSLIGTSAVTKLYQLNSSKKKK